MQNISGALAGNNPRVQTINNAKLFQLSEEDVYDYF